MSVKSTLGEHWPEYLIEAWALGCFMLSAGVFATLLGSPRSPLYALIPSETARTVLVGLAMGTTAIALIHSPWGKRSGAHMNPAVTLTFLRLGKVAPVDAVFFILAQTLGGTLGVLLAAAALGSSFTDPPVSYAATVPGPRGAAIAFVAETIISFGLMAVVLLFSSISRLARFTGLAAGCLVALYISVESPLSGMSMNPARTFASAAPGMNWQHFWVYLVAPILGMFLAAQLHLALLGARAEHCAKLLHPDDVRCIHCGYKPNSILDTASKPSDLRSLHT
jgi:aquaporin Z